VGLKAATGLFLAGIALCSCQRSGPRLSGPLPQRGYLWQREWTPAVVDALKRTQGRLDGIVLLAAEIDWAGTRPEIIRSSIDWPAVRIQAKPCSIALRVAPFSGTAGDDDPRIQSVVKVARSLLEEARKHNVNVREFQLDFDCAQKELANYRQWLRLVRTAVRPVRLVITTLPAWLGEPAFARLLGEVDGFVLQVHSIPVKNGESVTLCDPRLAQKWVEKAARFHLPFSVALPTYRCSAGYNQHGKLLSVAMDSVQPAWPPNTRILEFTANADDMAMLVREWEKSRPAELRELLWYRIPVATDVRNWQWVTLSAVMAGRKPLHRLEAVQEGTNPIDLSITNTGETDEPLDATVTATWNASVPVAADALPGWVVDLAVARAVFTRAAGYRPILPPGATRRIGWLRYDQPTSLHLVLERENEARP
jgi:hypothetical protein